MMKRWNFILLLIFAKCTFAQDVTFTASAPEMVEVGQQFRLIYTVNSQAQNFTAQAVDGIVVLAGPSTSQSSNVSIINGNVTQNFELRYTYVVQATKEGEFTIPPAEVKVEGKTYKSNSIKIEVIKSGTRSDDTNNNTAAAQYDQQSPSSNQESDGDVFLRLFISKKNVYREEQLIATIKLYTKVNIVDNGSFKLPSFDGFLTEDITEPFKWNQESYNGQIYRTGIVRQFILYPQKEGTLTLSPSEIEIIFQKRSERRSRSMFDEFFGNYENVRRNLISNSVSVNVKELQGNKPFNFSGAVGSFKLNASIDNSSVKTNDAINLKVKISGNGNIKYINPLEIDFPNDFDVYDPKIADNINYSTNGAVGSKTFEYLMIPRHAGEFTIPAFSFSYFDTETDKYKIEKAGPFNVKVEKSEGDTTVTVSTAFTKEDVKFFGQDIRFIKTNNIKLKPINKFLFGSRIFYFTYVLSLSIFIIVFAFRRKKIKENANVMLVKNKKANKFARKRLKKASNFIKQNNKEYFYEELVKALWGYLSDKLGIPFADLSKDYARTEMIDKKVDEEYIDQILSIIDRCEYARYAPVTEETKMDTLYNDAIKVISKLQQKLK